MDKHLKEKVIAEIQSTQNMLEELKTAVKDEKANIYEAKHCAAKVIVGLDYWLNTITREVLKIREE